MSCTLLNHEFSGVDLTLALDVHHDAAATGVVIESTRRRLCIGNGNLIDLQNYIARLNAKLFSNALTHRLYERTLRAANASFCTNCGSERHKLNLSKHRDLWCIDVRKIGDFDIDLDVLSTT